MKDADTFHRSPILNSPYELPGRHWALDESRQPTERIGEGRRAVSFISPIPTARKTGRKAQRRLTLDEDIEALEAQGGQQYELTKLIGGLRGEIAAWRTLPESQWRVTPETARLLKHWRHHRFSGIRPFFCQVEAVETAIWLTEVAPAAGKRGRDFLEKIQVASEQANPGLSRLALKLATGAGKTTVMAMLIAWQTVNAVRHPASRRFTRGFLVVTPGITIRDRLRVLKPNDPDSYYASRELVPPDMLREIAKAKIVITNYHAFQRRETMKLARGSRALLRGRGPELATRETEGEMLARVMPELMTVKGVLVLNDEAHHCYREKAGEGEEGKLKGDDRLEAKRNREAARVWISGLEAAQRRLGLKRVIDLSATPFFLRGSGYAEGTLFPWTVSDFSLMDAIECGIVKLPRVPVVDNVPGAEMPMYRNLWEHIGKKMPKKGRGSGATPDPTSLPIELQMALDALYGHYDKTFRLWEDAGIDVPPCFIVVCNNTATSKLVYDYIAGFHRESENGAGAFHNGRLPLFRNFDAAGAPLPRPRSLLIDSQQLESGDALDRNFRAAAADEIERFRREIVERGDGRQQAENLTDQDLLREVMNTVGKAGRLGGEIRCVVSVAMLTEGWEVFVQIGDENVHRVRALMDEIFRDKNFVSLISVQTTTGFLTDYLGNMSDFILWYAKDKEAGKARPPFYRKDFVLGKGNARWLMFPDGSYRGVSAREKRGEQSVPAEALPYAPDNMISQGRAKARQPYGHHGLLYDSWEKNSHWKATYPEGMNRLSQAGRIHVAQNSIRYVRFHTDFGLGVYGNMWTDTGTGNFTDKKVYVVQTNTKVVERCILMASDPGDLVLDPTCGSGTTAYVAEQWGRRWITIDTSRVALALARARIMGARYPYYLLADSREGQLKEAALARKPPSEAPTYDDVRHGFVYERVPHITLKSIANNAEIDVIHERMTPEVEAALSNLNHALRDHAMPFTVGTGGREGKKIDFGAPPGSTIALASGEPAPANGLLEWEVPREPPNDWNEAAREAHEHFWQARIARQREIDGCIAASAEYEHLYDKPYQDNRKVRVAGPFTVESVSPHRLAALDEHDELLVAEPRATYDGGADVPRHEFAHVILENLRTAGVQQARKAGRIAFSSLEPWPGQLVCAEGRYLDGDGKERSAGVFIGPEFGTVSRPDLVSATREAADAGFDALIACAFNFEAHATEFTKLGRVPVLQARMNADLHMAGDLKKTNTANLFVIFGEPDIDIEPATGSNGEPNWLQVRINGVDVFDPSAGEVRSDGPEGIACWFVDTDYNEESFFVRQAYFLGAGDPYKSLRTTLKAEIDSDAWATLHSDTSRPFPKPTTGRIAVKVINHLGDEVMKVFGV